MGGVVLQRPILDRQPAGGDQYSALDADRLSTVARDGAKPRTFTTFRTLVQHAKTSHYCFQSLAHSFAPMKTPTPFLSFDSALLYQNMGGGGVAPPPGGEVHGEGSFAGKN